MTRAEIFAAINLERARQDEKHGANGMGGANMSRDRRHTVMSEELGEVARAILDGDEAGLRAELTQVAACAVGFLEQL